MHRLLIRRFREYGTPGMGESQGNFANGRKIFLEREKRDGRLRMRDGKYFVLNAYGEWVMNLLWGGDWGGGRVLFWWS